MSSSVLYERLEELTGAGLVARDDAGDYLLTDLGAALGARWTLADAGQHSADDLGH